MRAVFFLFFVMISGSFQQLQGQSVTPVSYFPVADWDTSPYKSFRYTQKSADHNNWINFRLLYPNQFDSSAEREKKYPLILTLHGGGESARMSWNSHEVRSTGDTLYDNNELQLVHFGKELLEAVNTGRFPGFVLSPQNFYGSWITADGGPETEMHRDLKKTLELLEYLIKNLPIDPERVYIQGISNGGVATWFAAYQHPELFAAALPMSASGFPEMAGRLADIPFWVFQGGLDINPRPEPTEETIKALRGAGGRVRYSLYPEAGHNSWDSAFAEPELFKWLLSQNKNKEAGQDAKAEEEPEEEIPEKDLNEREEEQGKETNQVPLVNAGSDSLLVLPQDTFYLEGTASDSDGEIVQWEWTKAEGPEAIILYPDSLKTPVSFSGEGNYTFRLTITDEKGAQAHDDLTITVEGRPLAVDPFQRSMLQNITLFPNPFTSTLHVKMEAPVPYALDVFITDPTGKTVHRQEIPAHSAGNSPFTLSIEGESLQTGVYYIRLYNKHTQSAKIFMLMKE